MENSKPTPDHAEESINKDQDNGFNPAGIVELETIITALDQLETHPLDINRTLPLPPLETTSDSTMSPPAKPARDRDTNLLTVCRSHTGLVRNNNQDSSFVFTAYNGGEHNLPTFGLFVVADGMGGHKNGDVAGRIVSRTAASYILSDIYLPLLSGRPPAEQRSIAEVLEEAAAKSNAALRSSHPEIEMGTTLTAGLLFGQRLYIIHVGDSRAYLFSDNTLKLLTTDHTVVKALEEAGQLTAEQAAIHPNRNMLYRALMGEDLEVDSFSTLLPRHGKLILCSDGLWGMVPEEAIAEVLGSSRSLPQMADDLIEMALVAGGNDNITVVLADFTL